MRWFKRRPISPRTATPAEAVQFIASVCDGAVVRDGLGFQKEHVAMGHALGRAAPATWERWQGEWALYFVRYYRRQLTEAGFDVDQILTGRRRRSTRSDSGAVERWADDPYGFAEQRLWNGARGTAATSAELLGAEPRPATASDPASVDRSESRPREQLKRALGIRVTGRV